MPSSSLRDVTRWVLLGLLASCGGCGATGLDWVGEAHLESASLQRVNAEHSSSIVAPTSVAIPATAEPSDSRPRLNHTVTLGEVDVAATQSEAAPSSQGPTVIVNNYNQVNVVTPSFGYGNYGYALGSGRFSPAHVTPHPSQAAQTAAPSPLPGQSWPAVADHGPSFPYQASPASSWTRTR